jgi:hypothetical protein
MTPSSVRQPGAAAVHSRAIIESPDPVEPTNDRKLTVAVVVRTTRHHLVNVLERRRSDVDDDFALARLRLGEVVKARRFAKRVQDGSFHGHPIFFFLRRGIKTRAARWRPNEKEISHD